jgi:hypothetical protein
MSDGLLSKLPPLDKKLSVKRAYWQAIKPAPSKKTAFSVPKAKQVAKLLEGIGKQVTGINVQPDGFTVTAVTPGAEPEAGKVPGDVDWWEKKVLGNGST